MPACIVICRTNKGQHKKGKILFINAKHLVTRKNSESYLEENHIREIVKLYNDYADSETVAKVVSMTEIQQNDNKLNINLYAKGISQDSNVSWREYPTETLISRVYEQSRILHESLNILSESINLSSK